ncbi:MAG: serine protease [Kiritimatiellia bacterium]|nr:serine protease [Kiritimatiellia bacterium]
MSTFSNRSRFAFVVFLALALLIPMDRPLAEVAPIPLPAPPGAEPINNLYRSVFRIESTAQSFDYKAPWNSGGFGGGNGTGFLVGRNKILTNAHVISNTRRLQIRKYDEAGIYSARVLFIAQDCDLALIELEDPSVIEHLQPLELGSVPPLESEVRVIGYPIGANGFR